MKILVFMCDNRPLSSDLEKADYNSMTACINYIYCKRNGYDFMYSQCIYKEKIGDVFNCIDPNSKVWRHAAWSRLIYTMDLIKNKNNYDYIVYIDSDCIFRDHDMRIEKYIENHLDKDIIFINNNPWHLRLPCSGFYACKPNAAMDLFFKNWYEMDIPFKNNERYWEQDALWLLIYNLPVKKQYLDKLHGNLVPTRGWPTNIGLIDDVMFFRRQGQFLTHICGADAALRKPTFSKAIEINNIDFPTIIDKIQQGGFILFDTSIYYIS